MSIFEAQARQNALLADSRGIALMAELAQARKLDRLEGAARVVRARLGLSAAPAD